jgi:hypothetical protein
MKQLKKKSLQKESETCAISPSAPTAFYFPFFLGIVGLMFLSTGCKKENQGGGSKDQPFEIQWSKAFGGTKIDAFSAFAATPDGAYVVAATSASNDGDVSGNQGMNDMWVYKIDRSGNILWQKSIGGTDDDDGWSVISTSDDSYLVAGNMNSNDGKVTGNHGQQDILLVKLNSMGNMIWQKSLGGSGLELIIFSSIISTADGGCLLLGNTNSNDGDVSGNHGGLDFWLVKLNSSGNIMWQKTYGGSADDVSMSIAAANGGGYLLTGQTNSNDGDVTGNHGGGDGWVVKVNESGNIIWQKTFGGSKYDILFLPKSLSSGGYILSGQTSSPNDGDIKGFHGDFDAWVVKLDGSGNLIWQKPLGSSQFEGNYAVLPTSDDGYLVGAFTNGNDGDVTGNHGGYDAWVVKLNNSGSIVWQKTYGGSGDDVPTNFLPTVDGGYIFGGQSNSNDGDVKGHHGKSDAWLFTTKPSVQ